MFSKQVNDFQKIYSNKLEAEFIFRKDQQEQIGCIFENIRRKLTQQFQDDVIAELQTALNEFQISLLLETAQAKKDDYMPLATAQKLKMSIEQACDPKISLAEKNKSVQNFKNYARGASTSTGTKAAIGAVVGAVLGLAILVATVAGTCGIAALFSLGALPLVLSTVGMALTGARIGLRAAKGQDDERGAVVSSKLKDLLKNKNTFFACRATVKPVFKTSDPVIRYLSMRKH